MAKWIVPVGEAVLAIETDPGKPVSMDITAGPLSADTNDVERIRSILGAAIGVAQGELQ